MLIGQVAQQAGVTAKTLRFYEDAGLLPAPDRTSGGYRDYPGEAVDRVAFVRSAQAAGFTLGQVKQVLDIRDGGEPPCEHVRVIVDERLAEVERRLVELRRTRDQLRTLARRTTELDPADCTDYCRIIEPSD